MVHLKGTPIFEQLNLEEALLRTTEENWCVLNWKLPPAIVLGISGEKEQQIDMNRWMHSPIPIVRRYSGGGTVVVDEHTLCASFIFQKAAFSFACYPESILEWSYQFYQAAFALERFCLRGTDYTLSEHKCGGNAQYLQKNRFVHHTTFLWDFDEKMELLRYPPRVPTYRMGRSHREFLCCLKEYFLTPHQLFSSIKRELSLRYLVQKVSYHSLNFPTSYRRSTRYEAISQLDVRRGVQILDNNL